jgi:hypothetical protein
VTVLLTLRALIGSRTLEEKSSNRWISHDKQEYAAVWRKSSFFALEQ